MAESPVLLLTKAMDNIPQTQINVNEKKVLMAAYQAALHKQASLKKIFSLLDLVPVDALRNSTPYTVPKDTWVHWAITDPILQALSYTGLLDFFLRFLNAYFWKHRYYAYGLRKQKTIFKAHHRKIVLNLCILYRLGIIKPFARLSFRGSKVRGWCPVWVLTERPPNVTDKDIYETVKMYGSRCAQVEIKASTP